MRVATSDPMLLPIFLRTNRQAALARSVRNYSYGFLCGFLFALLLYKLMWYASLRQTRYILYSLYLGMFLCMNISYTGHGFQWF